MKAGTGSRARRSERRNIPMSYATAPGFQSTKIGDGGSGDTNQRASIALVKLIDNAVNQRHLLRRPADIAPQL